MGIEVIQLVNKKYYVYEWFIKETGEIFYVGKGSGNRVTSNKDRNEYFKNIRKKYECDYKIVYDNLSEEEAYNLEFEYGTKLKEKGLAKACYVLGKTNKFVSSEIKRKISKTLTGKTSYNKGRKMPEEQKEKLSLLHLGKKQSAETIEKRRQSMIGHKVSDETKMKLSYQKIGEKNPMYNKKQSLETIDKRRAKLINHEVSEEVRNKIGVKNGKPVNQINPKTGEIINTYCSCCEAARQLNLNYSKISRVCLGGRKTTGGFSWKYVD